MIDREKLLAAGYKNYGTYGDRILFQKRIDDRRGQRYFIDVYEYDWKKMGIDHPDEYSYEVQVHLYSKECGESMMSVTVMDTEAKRDVETLEEFVDQLWTKLGAGYYRMF